MSLIYVFGGPIRGRIIECTGEPPKEIEVVTNEPEHSSTTTTPCLMGSQRYRYVLRCGEYQYEPWGSVTETEQAYYRVKA